MYLKSSTMPTIAPRVAVNQAPLMPLERAKRSKEVMHRMAVTANQWSPSKEFEPLSEGPYIRLSIKRL